MSNTPDRSSDLSQIFDEFLRQRSAASRRSWTNTASASPISRSSCGCTSVSTTPSRRSRRKGRRLCADPGVLPRIPGYEVEAVLGQGGAGVVFRARDLRLGRPVAIKMLLAGAYAGPTELMRFQLKRRPSRVCAIRTWCKSTRSESTRDGRISRWSSSMAAAWPRNSRPLPPLTQGARKLTQGARKQRPGTRKSGGYNRSLGRGTGRYAGGGGIRRSSRRHHSS